MSERQSAENDARSAHVRRTRRFTISPTEAAALDRLLDAYLATDSGDPGWLDLAAFKSRLEHAQMDHAAYEAVATAGEVERDHHAPTCSCGHGLHLHDNETDPPLCESCGDYTRCDAVTFCGSDVAALLARVRRESRVIPPAKSDEESA